MCFLAGVLSLSKDRKSERLDFWQYSNINTYIFERETVRESARKRESALTFAPSLWGKGAKALSSSLYRYTHRHMHTYIDIDADRLSQEGALFFSL